MSVEFVSELAEVLCGDLASDDPDGDGGDDLDGFGHATAAARIIRFNLPNGEGCLAMHRTRGGSCGTDAGGWLSGWGGQCVTGLWYDSTWHHDGGPDRFFDRGGFQMPAPGSAAVDATVCFDDNVGPCDFHMAIRVANCGDHYRFALPPVHYCSSGAGLAYCADHCP